MARRDLDTAWARTDPVDREACAHDWGRFKRRMPRAVVSPSSAEGVARVVRRASSEGFRLAIRGGGHSQRGQTLTDAGVVLATKALNRIRLAGSDVVRAQGGAEFGDVADFMRGSGRLPAVLPDYGTITVGGFISAGGIGTTSHRHGTFVHQLEQLEVVTGTGERVRCSMDRNADLFHAARSGQGQFGVITEAWIRTRTLPPRCRMYELHYSDPDRFVADIERVMEDGRFDHLKAEIRTNEGVIVLNAGIEYGEEPDDARLLGGMGYEENVFTRDVVSHGRNQMLPSWGFSWEHFHPWQDWVLPFGALGNLVDPHWLDWRRVTERPMRWVGMYFLAGEAFRRSPPLLMMPPGNMAIGFSILNVVGIDRRDEAMAALEYLEQVDRAVVRMGGTRYLSGACRFDRTRWAEHYGRMLEKGGEWKREFDPAGVFEDTHMPFGRSSADRGRDGGTSHAGGP